MTDHPHCNIPVAVEDLITQSLNGVSPEEHLAQKIAFIRSDVDDLVKLRVHKDTAHLFKAEEGNLWSLLSTIQFLVSDLRLQAPASPAPAFSMSESNTTTRFIRSSWKPSFGGGGSQRISDEVEEKLGEFVAARADTEADYRVRMMKEGV